MRNSKLFFQLRGIVAELEAGSGKLVAGPGSAATFAKPGQNSVSQRAFSSAAFATRAGNLASRTWAFQAGSTTAQAGAVAARLLGRESRAVEAGLWRRLFSSETPRRGWDKFYPKNKPRRPEGQGKVGKGEGGRFLWGPGAAMRRHAVIW